MVRRRRQSSKEAVDDPTSLVIENIPGRATKLEVMAKINAMGFQGSYNLLYMPPGAPGRGKHGQDAGQDVGNSGHAFINFKSPEISQHFLEVVANADVTIRSSGKAIWAHPARSHIDAVVSSAVIGRSSFWVENAAALSMARFSRNPLPHEPRGGAAGIA
eukprot:TRINITY_DN51836_c0_g1_i2.p1 TRINITY_DN51836_c0_g1~~TRINITY_DN51836_c0_g1_i2.p1  ORF type:complete len:160 (-),score=26.12 TRINITY_DN51836_c0_g1_i2:160-639(-)